MEKPCQQLAAAAAETLGAQACAVCAGTQERPALAGFWAVADLAPEEALARCRTLLGGRKDDGANPAPPARAGEFWLVSEPARGPDGQTLAVLALYFATKDDAAAVDRNRLHALAGAVGEVLDARSVRARLQDIEERDELVIDGSGFGVWDLNYENGALYWSPQCRRMMGVPQDAEPSIELMGQRVHPADLEFAEHGVKNPNPYVNLEFRVRSARDDWIWVRSRGKAACDDKGRVRRIAGSMIDITSEVESRNLRRDMWSIFSDDSMNLDQKIQALLDRACIRLGMDYGGVSRIEGDTYYAAYQALPKGSPPLPSPVDLADTFCAKVWKENDVYRVSNVADSPFAGKLCHRVTGFESYIGAPIAFDGAKYGTIWFGSGSQRPPYLPWEENMVMILAQAIGREMGSTMHLEALEDSEERFIMATRAANVGIMEWVGPAATSKQYWSDNLYRLLGYEPGEIPNTHEVFVGLMHPDDAKGVEDAVQDHIRNGGPLVVEMRMRHKTDGYRWFQGTGVVVPKGGDTLHMVGSIMDVHDLKLATKRAEAASAAKSQFLAMMSHEIRTPLNGVLGMMAALQQTQLNERQQSMVNVAHDSGVALLDMVNEILDLSKIEAGKFSLNVDSFDLGDLIRSIAAMYEVRAQQKGLGFALELDPEADASVRGDPSRLRQILNNLLTNAVKFTEAGEISLRVAWDGDAQDGRPRVRFDVRDTGIGIAEEDVERLFAPFSQLDSSTTRKFEGTGLGLTISKHLTEMMGGAITLDSAPGRGSTFTVSLPLERNGAAASAEGQDTVQEDAMTHHTDVPTRVLSVDDHPVNRTVVEAMLASMGVEVTSAQSGEEALKALETEAFDGVLLDIQMPNMDGVETLGHIRRRDAENGRPEMPVIALTANTLPEQVESYLAAGFDGHLAKPISPDALADAVSRIGQMRDERATGDGAESRAAAAG